MCHVTIIVGDLMGFAINPSWVPRNVGDGGFGDDDGDGAVVVDGNGKGCC